MLGEFLLSPLFSRAAGENEGSSENPNAIAKETVRNLELGIEVKSNSLSVVITITNRASEKRYLKTTPDTTLYRITLKDENGQLLKLTEKGIEEFKYGIGSVWVIELRKDVPWRHTIDLGPLFVFPEKGTVRCEISRLVHFSEPNEQPAKTDWMKFPPVNIVVGGNLAPDTTSTKPVKGARLPK
jgi:hypothetical protein